MKRGIRLRGIGGTIRGKVWQSDTLLRAGRLAALEICLDDSSVSRKHAEVRVGTDGSWTLRDLDSTNGSYVNGVRVPPGQERGLKPRDVVQFGKVAVMVELHEVTADGPPSDQMVLSATLSADAPAGQALLFAKNEMPRAGEQLVALLRAGHYLLHLQSEDQLLPAILNDAVSVLDAQRGVIVLAEGDGPLQIRALAVGTGETTTNRHMFSKRLANLAFAGGQSMLFSNVQETEEFRGNQSIVHGAMASVLCVLLRTPRRKLGVLHLDRGPLQEPFTEEDLHLADALAAHVSAGIECSFLLRKQKELFQKTMMMLAQAVELRDEYTGGHTHRVTRYATMLADKLELPEDQLELVRTGTPLHDIGKIGISDVILRKPGRLTAAEFAGMQTHTTIGAKYLLGIPELHAIIPIVRNHHERWDGTGYPDRLAGEEIPLLARIVSVCDAFDAMTSNRPYHAEKKGKPPSLAFAEVSKQSGRQFDPRCVAAFLDMRDQILAAMFEFMPDAVDGLSEAGPPTAQGLTNPMYLTPPPPMEFPDPGDEA